MKAIFAGVLCLAISFQLSAALVARDLDGNLNNGHEGVYDDVLDITWLANANLGASSDFGAGASIINSGGKMDWDKANTWIGGMNSAVYLGINTWRLPGMIDVGDDGCNFSQADTDCGYNVLTYENNAVFSELAFMYYDNLEALARFSETDGGFQSPRSPNAYGVDNAPDPNNYLNLFENIQNDTYWSSLALIFTETDYEPWFFETVNGRQDHGLKTIQIYAWAVADGIQGTAMPIPGAVWLFMSAFTGLIGYKRMIS